MKRSRAVSLLAAACAAVVVVGGATAPAAASGVNPKPATVRADDQPSTPVAVTQSAAGDLAVTPPSVPVNKLAAFTLNTSFASSDVEIVQLRNGVTMTQFDAQADAFFYGTAAAKGAAVQWFFTNTDFYGGIRKAGMNSFRLVMPVGEYWVIQFKPVGSVKPSTKAKKFTVTAASGGVTSPYADQVMTVGNPNGPDVFNMYSVPGSFRSVATTAYNKTGSLTARQRELHSYEFVRVPANLTTDEQVKAWLVGGGADNAAVAFSFGIMTPARYADVRVVLSPGRYVWVSKVPDANTGVTHDREGEFKVVTFQ